MFLTILLMFGFSKPMVLPAAQPPAHLNPPCDLRCQRVNHPWPGPGPDPYFPPRRENPGNRK